MGETPPPTPPKPTTSLGTECATHKAHNYGCYYSERYYFYFQALIHKRFLLLFSNNNSYNASLSSFPNELCLPKLQVNFLTSKYT